MKRCPFCKSLSCGCTATITLVAIAALFVGSYTYFLIYLSQPH